MVMSTGTAIGLVVVLFGESDRIAGALDPRIASIGDDAGGRRAVRIIWNAPYAWGNEIDGVLERGYQFQFAQTYQADGTPINGGEPDWATTTRQTSPATAARVFNAPGHGVLDGTEWVFRVRAVNRAGDASGWESVSVHAIEQEGLLIWARRALAWNNERLSWGV